MPRKQHETQWLSLVDEVSSVQSTIQNATPDPQGLVSTCFPSSLIFCISDCRVVVRET